MPTKPVTLRKLKSIVRRRFGGVLRKGAHEENGQCCALELLSVARALPWTDSPEAVRSFDLRSLNDINVSDNVRTECLLPVIAAYDGSLDWPQERQREVATKLAILAVQRLIAELPGLPTEIAARCRAATTREEAYAAAYAADAAAYAAYAAARAADAAARESVFRAACTLWLEAAQ